MKTTLKLASYMIGGYLVWAVGYGAYNFWTQDKPMIDAERAMEQSQTSLVTPTAVPSAYPAN